MLTAGRYQTIAIYPRLLPDDMPETRQQKLARSNAAQRYFNNLSCEEKLRWMLCANFDCKSAAFVTLTFRDEHLPESRKSLKKLMSVFFEKCRKDFNRRGLSFPYIYTVEGQAGQDLPQADSKWETVPWADRHRWAALEPDNQIPLSEERSRLHAHAFLLLPDAENVALVKSLWPWGKVHINFIRINDPESFRRLAAYVTKEARMGVRPVGERSYTPSKGLAKYTIDGRWCDATEDIAFPPGVLQLDENNKHNHVNGYHLKMISYRYPRENPAAPKPYQSKGRILHSQKRPKTK